MKIKYLLIAAICSVMFFSACSDDDETDVPTICPGTSIPENVLQSFYQIYGDVKDVKWQVINDYHVALFNGAPITKADNYTTSAWFTREGKQCQVDQDIDFDKLPNAVRQGFLTYKNALYPDWEVDDCEVVSRIDMGLIYVIEIEKGNQERELSFSENGDFLKDVLDDDDTDFIYPILVPDELQAALAQLFPESANLTILEIDRDDDEVEVDILDGTRHKEVTFTPNLKWISTEYEVTMQEASSMIDPAVMQKLIALAKAAGIDITNPFIQKNMEIEVVEHVRKGLYFEIEIELGDKELEVVIDQNGNITIDD